MNAAAVVNARINGTDCNLIDAIIAANTDTATGACAAGTPGADAIELLDNVTLVSVNNGDNGLPVVSSEMTIVGAGFTIARDAGATDAFRILEVDASGNLTLNNTTISGGNTPSGGGGIFNAVGNLTLNQSTVSGNATELDGGGIHNSGGTVTLTNSTVSGNSASRGGGIYSSGEATQSYGTVTLINSTVSGNSACLAGGGFYNDHYEVLTLERSLFAGNSAPQESEIYNFSVLYPGGSTPVAIVNSDNFNLFGHSGLTNEQAFLGVTPGASDITATSDGTMPTALTAILDTTLQVNAPGNTATHALVTGSPAVDIAPSGPATDQRGVSRPQGCAVDIGAYELEQAPCPVNEPPVANAGPDQSVFRNDVVTVSGTWTDPNEAGDNPYAWAWDLDGDAITFSVSSIFQDEPTNGPGDGNASPDGQGTGSTAEVRSERQGGGNGRYYHITISASDGNGGFCNATVQVSVPKNQGKNDAAVDDGPLYDSTQP